ncbi:MAG: aminodeoxychorismate/anthranilate synthase component II [Dehalococcoidales bacterium]|jgi:anthranilate synthase/aminodeoxychorismate synthase-like glutamine amidotransferase|nr:aminodeoxychorismate/anthranilate synthase component II [Dehalococcoidales bacterium]
MIYVIDHNDSFTFNLVHLLALYDDVVVSNYKKIDKSYIKKSHLVVFSPGPGHPKNYTETISLYKSIKNNKKILGVCLGFQIILYSEKAKIIPKKYIQHGYKSNVKVNNLSLIFKNNTTFSVANYNSLKLLEPFKSEEINITMRDTENNIAMALENINKNIFGFQFHPDSFLTKKGKFLVQKIIFT